MSIARADISDIIESGPEAEKLWVILRVDLQTDIHEPLAFESKEWQWHMRSAYDAYLSECEAQRTLRGRDL